MSEYRVEKKRAEAELTLTTGARIKGCFFLWASSHTHAGPERVGDLLNEQTGFFPFQRDDGDTALYNRAQIVVVRLPSDATEVQVEPGYEVATRRVVSMLLSTGERISGTVAVYRPTGRDRLSDYARGDEMFRYVETGEHTIIVNSAHMVELKEIVLPDGEVVSERQDGSVQARRAGLSSESHASPELSRRMGDR